MPRLYETGLAPTREGVGPPKSVTAAPPIVLAQIGPHGVAVRTERRVRFGAPIRGRVVFVVEVPRAGIRHGKHEHRLVPDVVAVHAGGDAWRSVLIVHDSVPFLDRSQAGGL